MLVAEAAEVVADGGEGSGLVGRDGYFCGLSGFDFLVHFQAADVKAVLHVPASELECDRDAFFQRDAVWFECKLVSDNLNHLGLIGRRGMAGSGGCFRGCWSGGKRQRTDGQGCGDAEGSGRAQERDDERHFVVHLNLPIANAVFRQHIMERPAEATGWGWSLLPGFVVLTRVRLYGQGFRRFYSLAAGGHLRE